jgi:hypothetical protein
MVLPRLPSFDLLIESKLWFLLFGGCTLSLTFLPLPHPRQLHHCGKQQVVVGYTRRKGTSDCCRRWCHPAVDSSTSISTSTSARIRTNIPPLEIVSYNPLILLSTVPVLTSEECHYLITSLEQDVLAPNANNSSTIIHNATIFPTTDDNNKTQTILSELNHLISKLTNCPSHDGETECPRYISYHEALLPWNSTTLSPSLLLPDGLHIDINNGKLFRHVTALIYLTDDLNDTLVGGATTFPFAIPSLGNTSNNASPFRTTTTTTTTPKEDSTSAACFRLVEHGIYHTARANRNNTNNKDISLEDAILLDEDRKHMENIATQLFLSQQETNRESSCTTTTTTTITADDLKQQQPSMGIRITPQQGHMCIFYSWCNDGRVDPRSFHGGEAILVKKSSLDVPKNSSSIIGPKKALLTFFKEVPISKFQNLRDFLIEVTKSRQWAINQYSKVLN